ncbi:glucose 1-dehydrogenase [Actinacidiphila oryziradicis]|jgi:NAD(P)-dependent dehydrogenase (short-subunit alcohol dehydrogenase family)|uniref:Glucose 1-dehydrogenase n=1 Tax=Actinacidiphila oryziradicis TaxID=2571141 RepID=A0A4U0RVE2_9ACTN|nr:glucose 1-dehydrogenase [Actinacidiphila oryziradicis]MCW2870853.1 dehydrogenase [Actinacidiphila oryziradicis]TJZ99466.1 glucose 1-dehydrogenase [Actinacidiphila oryziradicis]
MSVLDQFRLNGKVAVVTGGNRGIGKAIAVALAEAGASVAIASRDEARNGEAVAELTGLGATAISTKTDVTSRADIVAMRDQVTAQLGPIDILVNNAGIGIHGESLTIDDDSWDRVMATNLDAVWKVSQVVGESMVERGTGSIVNVGSMSGMIINRPQWHAPYGVSKAGVHHLTRSLAAEWAPKSVRVNAIAPGYTKTEISDIDLPEYKHYWIDEVPMQRYAQASEIAPAALYLASPASSFVTGEILVIDGGYTLW